MAREPVGQGGQGQVEERDQGVAVGMLADEMVLVRAAPPQGVLVQLPDPGGQDLLAGGDHLGEPGFLDAQPAQSREGLLEFGLHLRAPRVMLALPAGAHQLGGDVLLDGVAPGQRGLVGFFRDGLEALAELGYLLLRACDVLADCGELAADRFQIVQHVPVLTLAAVPEMTAADLDERGCRGAGIGGFRRPGREVRDGSVSVASARVPVGEPRRRAVADRLVRLGVPGGGRLRCHACSPGAGAYTPHKAAGGEKV